ncbi:MAG: rRNA pseudouridine synthase [Clostridia bacterium]|nr:rRNA pseudouridine synthase [Clostridia bacterium]
MRINKFLASCGICSRRKAEELILANKVTVNGVTISDLATDIKDSDTVTCNGKTVKLEQNKVYVMLNKPKCYICSLKDEKDRQTVLKLTKGIKERIFPIGRLDFNTEGLLLLTNDGDFANSIIHPSKHIEKTYEVKTKQPLTNRELASIRKGIVYNAEAYLPAKVKNSYKADDGMYVTLITITEGKNHEVRNIFAAVNHKVHNLKRLRIGALDLGDLPMGKYKKLSQVDIDKIFRSEKC